MKTFKLGGIHPKPQKFAAHAPLEMFPLPKKGVVLLTQHIGTPAAPVVAKGDKVKVGQLLGRAEAFMCANVHSPYSGTVTEVGWAKDAGGIPRTAVYIDVEGDEWLETIDRTPEVKRECELEAPEIVAKLKEMGVVGLGGATFPTHIKYSIPEGKHADYLLINGVECEPYLSGDGRLMVEHTEELMVGISILQKALNGVPVIVGIECNKPHAIMQMEHLAAQFKDIRIEPLKMKYPQGGEKQLIDALTGRRVPSGKLPIDVGCVVSNVSTAYAVYEAVQKNKPLVERLVTVTGKDMTSQHNYKIRLGIPLKDVIQRAWGELPDGTEKVISGGPMMGKAICNLDSPIVKGSASILVMPKRTSHRGVETNCIRCGKCVKACPMGLEPYMFSLVLHAGQLRKAAELHLLDCLECGCCQWSCPANKPLVDEIRLGKQKLRR